MPVRQRARPFYRPGKLVYGVFLAVCMNAALVGGIVALALMLAREDRSYGMYVLSAIGVYAVFRILRYSHALGDEVPSLSWDATARE